MRPDDPELKAVEQRLAALVRCVLAKAAADEEFAGQLKEILLSESLRTSVRKQAAAKTERPVFDPVRFLDASGEEALRQHLSLMPKSELADVARRYRVAPPKRVKGMEQPELVQELMRYAEQRLTQGNVFLKLTTKAPPGQEASPSPPRAGDRTSDLAPSPEQHSA